MPIEFVKWPQLNGEDPCPWNNAQLVGSPMWCALIPHLHHALVNPTQTWRFPRYRHTEEDEHLAYAFWETALYLMHTLLGWSDPGRGLQWWHAQDFDDQGDERLRLLREVWVGHPHFDAFAAWCWQRGTSYGARGAFWFLVGDLAGPRGGRRIRGTERRGGTFLGEDWWTRVQQNTGVLSGPFFETSSENLHLGHSMLCDPGEATEGELLRTGPGERRAVLMLPTAKSWYRQLLLYGRGLPDLGGRSWHVDVVIKPLGHLGTFRRSRETGLWFQGRHQLHIVGQVAQDELYAGL